MIHKFILSFPDPWDAPAKTFFWGLFRCLSLRLWCRKSRNFKDTWSTRWKMTMPRSLDAVHALNVDEWQHARCNWHMASWLRWFVKRRVLEKKIYRIFCFLDEDMDSHSLKEQMLDSHRCFQKYGEKTQIIHFNRVFHSKPSILGYQYFWKHPYLLLFLQYQWIDAYLLVVSLFLQPHSELQICFLRASLICYTATGYISKSALRLCRDKLFDLARIDKTTLDAQCVVTQVWCTVGQEELVYCRESILLYIT